MEAGKRTIREIFNRGRNLEIPFFQRSYVWGEEQWERFLEDMKIVTKEKTPYFLGSIILKQQEITSNKDQVLTIIDGQQRLTTLNIFLKVVCLMKNIDNDFTEVFKKQRDKSIILLHNHNDIESFNKILNLTELEDFNSIPNNNNILLAYRYFKENINEDLIDFFDILDNVVFVGIDLNTEEDEQQIFDTINSLGVRLTTAELLKNHFFNRDDIERYTEYWRETFEKDTETKNYWDKEITTGRLKRDLIDIFFHAYLQIKIQDTNLKVNTEDKNKYAKVENLFESYKNFIKDYLGGNTEELLKEIKEYANLFIKNFDFDIVDKTLTKEYGIERINAIIFGLDTNTLIPYILYILKNVDNIQKRNELFEVIETYIMRRMITHESTKNYNQLFSQQLINNEVLSKEKFIEHIQKKGEKINGIPNNSDLLDGFNNSRLYNLQTKGIIYFIESKIRNNEESTKILGFKNYSLEHLMPKKWMSNWDSVEDKELREKKLLTLGNLAIITGSLNSKISNLDWEKKKIELKDCSRGIKTLDKYLELENWNEEEIEKRAKFLYEKAIEIWKSF